MIFCYTKIALLLVLSFCAANADHSDHHTHDTNHPHSDNPSLKDDILHAFDHKFHEYHHHHPVAQPSCGQICPKSISREPQWEIGQVYTIELDAKTLINVKEGVAIGLKAKVDVQVLNPCSFQMSLRDSQVSGVPNAAELSQQLDASPPLRLGSFDYTILGICPAPEEQPWTLNVKKAILSTFQLTTKDFTKTQTLEEVDFSGHCTTTYRPVGDVEGQDYVIERTKNLNKCHLRRKNLSGFSTKSLTFLTEFIRETIPLLKSEQKCRFEIKAGHPVNIDCTEEQTVSFQDRPLVTSTISLRNGGKAPAPAVAIGEAPKTAQSLLMTRDSQEKEVTTEAEVLELLKGICAQVSAERIAPEVTQSFHTLIHALRKLPEAETKSLDKAVKSAEFCPSPKLRQLFIGASAFAASDPSIQTIINAWKDKELRDSQFTILLGLVALKTKPSEESVNSLVPLAEQKDSPRPLALAVSILVRNFCKRTENCHELPAVKKIVSAFSDRLTTSDCNLEKITLLKAFENLRVKQEDPVRDKFIALIQDSSADAGVRIAAVQALSCCIDDALRQQLIDIVAKDSEPTEVRLTVFRDVIASKPTVAQLEALKAISDPQIKNYIQTFIKNLKKSTNEVRKKVLPENAPEFDEPRHTGLGTTRNIQFQYKGAYVDVDVIHPKGSVVPNLLSLSVNIPIGEKNYELLDIQIRHQGLEAHLKKLVSKGFSGAEVFVKLSEEALELLEHLRNPEHTHDVKLQIAVRISNQNILFIDTFEDLHTLAVLLRDRLRDIYNTESIDAIRAWTLLDSEVEVPALVGFPLVVHLNSSHVLAIKATHQTSLDVNARIRRVRSARTYLGETSAGITIKVANNRPGFEWHIRAEAAPTSDLSAEKIDGRIIKFKLNLPNERKTIFKIEQKTALLDGNGVPKDSNEIEGRSSNEDITNCRQIFGMDVCKTKTYLDSSPIPNVEYYVTKNDASLESLEITLEKPGPGATRDDLVWTAKVNAGKREYLAEIQVKNPREGPKKLNLKLQSPVRTITADAQLTRSTDGNATKLELDLKLPKVIDINTKINAETTGESGKNVDLFVEYQPEGGNKETLKITRKYSFNYKREKKSKTINISYFGEIQSSQYPEYNSKVNYYTSLRPYQNSKTEASVEWGKELKDKLALTHISKMDVIELRPFQMVSENSLTVEATPLDINYNFKLNSDISTVKSKPKLINLVLEGKDVLGRPDREIRSSLKYERQEEPIQQNVNFNLVYPGREMSYVSEVKQIKDLTFAGKIEFSPQKGKVVIINHKESLTNPTKDFFLTMEGDVSYTHKPDKHALEVQVGWESPDKFLYKRTLSTDGKKFHEILLNYDKKTGGLTGQYDRNEDHFDFKVDNIHNARSASWGVKHGQKSYKMSAIRVPKESLTLKLDSSENSKLKELKIKLSRKDKSTFRLVTDESLGLAVDAYIDPYAKDTKRAHLEYTCEKHKISHVGDISYTKADRKLVWNSKTLKEGKPYLTLELQCSPKDRTFIILKKIKGPDAVSKFEYFYDKGVYAATLDTSKWSAIVEGQSTGSKRIGKIGFVNKEDNYEHKSQYNISNGILTIKSISDQDKATFTKLDAVIGRRIVSTISLITPERNGQFTLNPLGEKKTLVIKYVSPKYDLDTNGEWVPRKYLKLDSVSKRKVDPIKEVKVNAHFTRNDESQLRITAPALDVDIKRVKTPKDRFIFNTTMNGYNEVQEYDATPGAPPIVSFLQALGKFLESYTSDS